MCETTNIILRKFWKEDFNILIPIRLIIKVLKEVTMKWLKTAWRKLCLFGGNNKRTQTGKRYWLMI